MFSITQRLSVFLMLSTALAIGILRFSYTALLPSTRVAFEWSTSFASLLGSANLLGYLIGAFWAMRLAQNARMLHYLTAAGVVGSLSLLCCAFAGFNGSWYIFWRLLSGICGGLLMILAPTVVAQCCAPEQRLKINFIGFSGVGIGVLAATLFLPYLDQISIRSAWLILAAFAFSFTLILASIIYPFQAQLHHNTQIAAPTAVVDGLYKCLIVVYGCSAFAYIPHSLFWVDYLSQSLNLSLYWINLNWMLYGLGSALGAVSAYGLALKLGHFKALTWLYSVYVCAILAAVFSQWSLFTLVSSFLTGLLNPAVVFLTSYTILQRYGLAYKKLWGMATMTFASVQLIGGLSFSALQSVHISYNTQFILAAMVLLLGTLSFIGYLKYDNHSQYKMSLSGSLPSNKDKD